MAISNPDTLVSNNPGAYGIVKAVEVAGHKTVANLEALYALADAILSESKTNAGNDAIGQRWYVVSESSYYVLKDWAQRKAAAGWKIDSVDLSNYLSKVEAESTYAKKTDLTGVSDKVSTIEGKLAGIDGTVLEEIESNKVEVVNDLTTGGVDKALSAEQGKALDGRLKTAEGAVVQIDTKISSAIKTNVTDKLGRASGIATLDGSGKVPAAQLPSYVDDVVDLKDIVEAKSNIPTSGLVAGDLYYAKAEKKIFKATNETTVDAGTTPESGKIYVDISDSKTYRWGGDSVGLVVIGSSLALGETASTAYAGDKGKQNRDAITSLPATIITEVTATAPTATSITINQKKVTKSGLNYGGAAAGTAITLNSATTGAAGLMSKDDKLKLDAIYAGNMALPNPVITGTWSFQNNAGAPATISPTPDANNPVIEKGYKASFTGTYSWTHQEGKKDPTKVQSGSSWSDLPSTGVQSQSYTLPYTSSNATVRIGIQAAKTGLMVSGSNVVPATGDDTASASKSVSFRDRAFNGILEKASAAIVESDIKGLSNGLVTSRTKSVSGVTTTGTQYYCYAYPKSLGDLTTIIQNGAQPVLEAFTKKTLTITNAAGLSVELNVYTSNNPGAFTNASLDFK